jgi:hypothetical protein
MPIILEKVSIIDNINGFALPADVNSQLDLHSDYFGNITATDVTFSFGENAVYSPPSGTVTGPDNGYKDPDADHLHY